MSIETSQDEHLHATHGLCAIIEWLECNCILYLPLAFFYSVTTRDLHEQLVPALETLAPQLFPLALTFVKRVPPTPHDPTDNAEVTFANDHQRELLRAFCREYACTEQQSDTSLDPTMPILNISLHHLSLIERNDFVYKFGTMATWSVMGCQLHQLDSNVVVWKYNVTAHATNPPQTPELITSSSSVNAPTESLSVHRHTRKRSKTNTCRCTQS